MINVAEKLKGCPKGTKLYSPLLGEVELVRIDMGNPRFSIIVKVLENDIPYSTVTFTAEGKWYNVEQSECLLFPSKDNRDWNKFDYRIKPEYRPFANAEECWQEMLKHTPFGWVESLKSNAMYEIQCLKRGGGGKIYSYDDIFFSNFEEFFKGYKFADGTPFGIKDE